MGYLTDVARRRIAAVLLVAGAIVVGLAIADVGPFSDPPTEEERAQGAVEKFFDAGQAKDFKAACTQLTDQARQTMEQRAGAVAAQRGLKGCKQILGLFLAKIRLDKVTDVSVSGNKARIEGELRGAGSKPRPTTVLLYEVRGEWKISQFGT